jgi:hypothetical protein
LKPTPFSSRRRNRALAFSFQIGAMGNNQLVDALAKCGKQFILPNFHGAQDGAFAPRGANSVAYSYVHSEVPHPI